MRMLYDYYDSRRLIVCIDTSNLDLLRDFASDRAEVRMLEVECKLTDAYLTGHALRIGLTGEQTSQENLTRLLPTIRGTCCMRSTRSVTHSLKTIHAYLNTPTPKRTRLPSRAFST